MHYSSCVYILLAASAHLYATAAQELSLGVNIEIPEPEKKLPVQANSFIQLISQGVFLDKTLFIKEILKIPSWYCVIIAPRRWGKTVNLDMLKTFVRMQVHPNGSRVLPVSNTPNYKLFTQGRYHSENYNITLERPLLISNIKHKRIIDVHLGQHPTVHLSFANLTFIRNKRKIKPILTTIIINAFEEHRYMIDAYDTIIQKCESEEHDRKKSILKREQFISHLNCRTNKTKDLERSIQFLIEELYLQFGNTKVFLFVDDYDQIFDRHDPDIEIPLFLKRILINYEQYIEKAIFTGVQPKLYSQNNVAINQFLYVPYPFYGFVKEEIDMLYRYYRITDREQDNIRYWYGGYEASKESIKEKIFSPSSVCNYINSRLLKPYWMDTNVRDIHLNDIFELSEFQFTFMLLLTGKNYHTKSPFISDRKWFHFDSVANKKQALSYLKYAGYLTCKIIHPLGSTRTYSFAVPNYEITHHLQTVFSKMFHKQFNTYLMGMINKTSTKWEQFLRSNESNSTDLENRVQKCFKVMLTHSKKDSDDVSEQLQVLVYLMVISTVSSPSLHFINWEFTRVPENASDESSMGPDFVLSSDDRGFIVDLKSRDCGQSLSSRTTRYIEMFQRYPALLGWKDIKLIFFTLTPDKNINIFSSLHSLSAEVG